MAFLVCDLLKWSGGVDSESQFPPDSGSAYVDLPSLVYSLRDPPVRSLPTIVP